MVADRVITVGRHDDNVGILGIYGLLKHPEAVFGVGPESVGVKRTDQMVSSRNGRVDKATHTLHYRPRYTSVFSEGRYIRD